MVMLRKPETLLTVDISTQLLHLGESEGLFLICATK